LLLALVVVVAMLLVPAAAQASGKCKSLFKPADTVFKNGYVYTVNCWQPTAQAVAVRDGKIIYVGCNQAAMWLVGRNTNVVDLHGKMMMPGLEDGHMHGLGYVACEMGYSGGTENQILQKIHDALLRADQLPYLNTNYVLSAQHFLANAVVPAGTVMTRDWLDRLSLPVSSGDPMATGTTRPIRVSDADGHRSIWNSIAINNAGITAATPTPSGSTIGHYGADAPAPFLPGDPNGIFADYTPPKPIGVPLPQPANANYLAKLANLESLNQVGITSIFRAAGGPSDCAEWKQVADDGKLTVRVNQVLMAQWVRGATDPNFLQGQIDVLNAARAQYNGYSSPNSPGTLAVDTAKVLGDGVNEYPAQTGAMLLPYNINIGTPTNPIWVPGPSRGPDPTVDDALLGFKMLDANHWNIHVHAIGNRAVQKSLDNFAAIQKANKCWDRRDAMTHMEFVDPSDFPRLGKLRVACAMQMQWAGRDVYTVDGVEGYINQDVLNTCYAAHSMLEGGGILAMSSDWPVDPLNPWLGVMVSVTRENIPNPAMGKYGGTNVYSEHITLPQALRGYTMGTAWELHQDKVTGSIAVGKYADLIVLDQNLFKIPAMQISGTHVLLTMIGGKVVWQDPVNPL
jgi:predicted amidohydrolase YtcJ